MEHNRNDGHNIDRTDLIQPNIGLENDVRQSIVELLNKTLADEALLSAKTRSAHWNVRGANFFELHTLYSTQYQLLNDISEEIAKRARVLGGYAIGSLNEFLQYSRIEEQPGMVPTTLRLLADHETCIRLLREDVRKCNEEYEDQGTVDLLVSLLRLHEKLAWMLRSYLDVSLEATKSPLHQ